MQPMMSFKRHAAELKRKKLQINLQFLNRNQNRNPSPSQYRSLSQSQNLSQLQSLSPSLIRHPNRNRILCQILIQQRLKHPQPGEE